MEKKYVTHVDYLIKIVRWLHILIRKDIEEHKKIKPNNYIYFEDLADVIIENITKLKENVHLIGKNNLKLSGKS